MEKSKRNEENSIARIADLIGEIGLYLDKDKYTFNYEKVEQLLTEAEQTVEQTARGVRPIDLPDDIPFSDSLDEEGQSSPYNYKGDMSPEEYERMMKLYDRDVPQERLQDRLRSADEKSCNNTTSHTEKCQEQQL